MEHDPVIRHDLMAWLGEDIYSGNELDRLKMAGLIFTNPELPDSQPDRSSQGSCRFSKLVRII
jgi:hypothetical protein